MTKFYKSIWLYWTLRVTICSVILASTLSMFITIYLYMRSSMVSLDAKVLDALVDIWLFWFSISWSLTILIALFRSLKYIFNRCFDGYMFKLFDCKSSLEIEVVGYGDLVKVWRKYFLYLVWIVMAEVVVAFSIFYFFDFKWFNIYLLYSFILVAGYFVLTILPSKVKNIKVVRC